MKLTIKICLGLLFFVSLSSAHAVLVSTFTVDREADVFFSGEETLVGEFKFRNDLMPGPITQADIKNFKWISGSFFGFDYNIWNYIFELRLRAILTEDGNILIGDDILISTYPPYQLSEELFGYEKVQVYLALDNFGGYCNTSEGPIDCDGQSDEKDADYTYQFTPLRVPEPSTSLLLSLGLLGIIGSRKLRLKSFN